MTCNGKDFFNCFYIIFAELSLKILDTREHLGLSQKEVAKRAKITQQQLSKLENGINCTMTTFLKVCNALGIKVELESPRIVHKAT
ncbi:MAG: helix-turn-helix transcriptional regulator [Thermodesulfovibrionia bacterium]|nr:helix-turn-helix transcriptional regulator [Thermodesulfovibrionia bacterium]